MHLSSLVLTAFSHSRLPGLGKGQVKLTYWWFLEIKEYGA